MAKDTKVRLLIDKKLSDYTVHWVVIAFKLIPALIAFLWNVAVRKIICPLVLFCRCLDHVSLHKEVY
jgi:hypothetical protein